MNERDKELWSEAAKSTKGDSWDEQILFMQRFADLIRADEREACLQLCKEHFYSYQVYEAICARGNK